MPASAPAIGLRERHKQQRRARILEAIRELLRDSPNETPTVERIAELAEELLCELEACLALAIDEDPRAQARRIVSETAELFIADAAVFRQLVNSWGRGGQLLQENPIPSLRAALRRGQASGMLRADLHVEALVGHIATACSGALRQWAAGQISDTAFRNRVRFAVDVVFAASASENWAAELAAPLARKRRQSSR
jgi:hypothetical protein